jgi:hypothetical protein
MTQARRALDDLGRTVVAVYAPPDTGQPRVEHKRLDELVSELFTLTEHLLLLVEEMEGKSDFPMLAMMPVRTLRDMIEMVLR